MKARDLTPGVMTPWFEVTGEPEPITAPYGEEMLAVPVTYRHGNTGVRMYRMGDEVPVLGTPECPVCHATDTRTLCAACSDGEGWG